MNLPEGFEKRMRDMLGAEFDAFIASYDRHPSPALRLNPIKNINTESPLLPCIKEPVSWAENGYYYDPDSEIRPGKHPYHEAGAYYIQEASAMIPASLFPPSPGEKVLDLCAAPGGKTTQLAASLNGKGLIVANEIHPQRASILSQNVERMGICNAVVTNHAPNELTQHFPDFFDKIVVDAPCSGEGMFRKEEQALTMWSQENIDLCAARQRDILEQAAKMLSPDGYLTYSTCTFAPEENEGVILSFLKDHPEFEVVDPKNPSVIKSINEGVIDRGDPNFVGDCGEYAEQIRKTVRLFPHHADGEGHFAALLHKSADTPIYNVKKHKDERKKCNGKRSNAPLTPESAYKIFEKFISDITEEEFFGIPCLYGEQLYLTPKEMTPDISGLKILRGGLHLGSIAGGNRFEPSHALALSLNVTKLKKVFNIDTITAASYIHGDTLPCGSEKGWHVITVDRFPVGWGKASDCVMKNHYPKGIRKNL